MLGPKGSRYAAFFGLAALVISGALYWLIDDSKIEKLTIFVMALCSLLVGVAFASKLASNETPKQVPSEPNTINQKRSYQNAVLVILGVIGTLVAVQQTLILSEQFALEEFKPEIVPTIENYTFLTNESYLKYPLSEKITFTSVNPHYLRVEISNLHFTTIGIPQFNKTLGSSIYFERPIVKYIDRGVVNQQFEIPFLLTFNASNIAPQSRDILYIAFFTSTNVKVEDLQNNDKTIYDENLTSGIAVPGKYVPRYVAVSDASTINEQAKAQ